MRRKITIHIDTNILIALLESDKLDTFQNENIFFTTFEKCIYEYFRGIDDIYHDVQFMIRSINNSITEDEKTQRKIYAFNVIKKASESKYYTKQTLIKALKENRIKQSLDFGHKVVEEHENQTDEEYILLKNKYCNDKKLDDNDILYLFYKKLYLINKQLFNKINGYIERYVMMYSYEQVFSCHNMNYFRQFLLDTDIPPKDLEIALSSLIADCNCFITSDRDLYKSYYSLGIVHIPCLFIDPRSGDIYNNILKTIGSIFQ